MPDDQRTTPTAPSILRYRVRGMDCPSCAGTIETALKRLPGTDRVRVNYHTQHLTLGLDEAKTPRAAVERQIHGLGFEASLVEAPRVVADGTAPSPAADDDAEPGAQTWWQGRKVRLALVIAALATGAFLVSCLVPGVVQWI